MPEYFVGKELYFAVDVAVVEVIGQYYKQAVVLVNFVLVHCNKQCKIQHFIGFISNNPQTYFSNRDKK